MDETSALALDPKHWTEMAGRFPQAASLVVRGPASTSALLLRSAPCVAVRDLASLRRLPLPALPRQAARPRCATLCFSCPDFATAFSSTPTAELPSLSVGSCGGANRMDETS